MNNQSSNLLTCGIDMGAECTKVVLGPSCEIVRNAIGNHTTRTSVVVSTTMDSSTTTSSRQIGSTADSSKKGAFVQLNRLLHGEQQQEQDDKTTKGTDMFAEFQTSHSQLLKENEEGSGLYSPSALLAMLLGNIRQSVLATAQRLDLLKKAEENQQDNDDDEPILYVFSVPSDLSDQAKTQLLDAAYAAGMKRAHLVNTAHSYAHAWRRKFPNLLPGNTGTNVVLVLDMGHCQTTAAVLEINSDADDQDTDTNATTQQEPFVVRSVVRHKALGAGSMDIQLWEHFQNTKTTLNNIAKDSRAGQRLLKGCNQLKELLSQLPQGTVTVEMNDAQDIQLTATRQEFQDLCRTQAADLKTLLQTALQQAGLTGPMSGCEDDDTPTTPCTVHAVEIVGGGCRIPWVQQLVQEQIGSITTTTSTTEKLSHSLSDTSAATGAALAGLVPSDTDNDKDDDDCFLIPVTEARTKLRAQEQALAKQDAEIQQRGECINRLESHVLELRSAKHSKHGALLPNDLETFLDDTENWIFSEQAEQASKDEAQKKLDETLAKSKELCAKYFEAIRKEQEEKDRAMELEAQRAQAERNDAEEDDNDDHDQRRLPKKRRMEIVMKNKSEANELFSDGNYKFAAARYTKALSHCAKFVDLSPDDIAEVDSVKLSLNLNLALAYLKLQNLPQALRVCNDALALDESSTKALYRRASVYYEQKNWSAAKQDILKALELVPDDKAIKKLRDRIDVQVKKQKAKEKKMAQKMFG